MNTHINNEYQSLRVIKAITRVYLSSSPQLKQTVRDLRHVITAYELCDREAALACNRYITAKYPIIYELAPRYGLRPMSHIEMCERTTEELQHMLYGLTRFLYDRLRMQVANSKTKV